MSSKRENVQIMLPYKWNRYKVINLESGKAKIYRQQKKDKIKDVYLLVNNRKQLLFRIENRELTFFLTSKCNQQCIMCPQELNIDSADNDLVVQRVIDNLDYSFLDGICFTGGEPLLKEKFIEQILQKSPKRIFITILTNGTIIPSEKILKSKRVKLCVPLYSYSDDIHNYMTGGFSFYKVIENLMKISQYETLIELRFVMTKKNVTNLVEYARFVCRNLPFVQNVAFMGMELTAEARKNKIELWCNPREYLNDLIKSIDILISFGMTAWIYNLPLCLFEEKYRKYLVKSISPWKIKYLKKCEYCEMKNDCGGFFYSDIKEFEEILYKVDI